MTTYPAPMCVRCVHLREGLACDAFPERIPEAILRGSFDHREPYHGDRGIRFEARDEEATS